MINITQDIHSLTEFKKNTNHFLIGIKKTGRPTVLTVNGKAKLVVMDAEVYQKMQDKIRLGEDMFGSDIASVNNSLRDFESGNYSTTDEVFSELKNIISFKGTNKKIKKPAQK